jgi:hypothetical protein
VSPWKRPAFAVGLPAGQLPMAERAHSTATRLSKKQPRFSARTLVAVLLLAGLVAGAGWLVMRSSRPADAVAHAGDVKHGPDGRLLYFDGKRWTANPLPAQDTPF